MPVKLRIVGDCNSCGACCRVLGVPLEPSDGWRIDFKARTVTVPDRERSASFVHFMATRGATFDREKRTMTVPYDDAPTPVKLTLYGTAHLRALMLKSTCPQLGPENVCKLHGSPDLPATCRAYPTVMDDLLEDCSYTKEPISGDE